VIYFPILSRFLSSWRQKRFLPQVCTTARNQGSSGLSAVFASVGATSVFLAAPLFACETIYSTGGNIGHYEYNAASAEWELVNSWSDPGALDYVPQPGDQ